MSSHARKIHPGLECAHRNVRTRAIARTLIALQACTAIASVRAADVVVQPASGSGFVVKDASGALERLRVNEAGQVWVPVLAAGAQQSTPICVGAGGALGPCAPGTGTVGPAGPQGPTGPEGPAGSLTLPYVRSQADSGPLLYLTNGGAGAALQGTNTSISTAYNATAILGTIPFTSGATGYSTAVRADNANGNPSTFGVWGSANNGAGKGVYGQADAAQGIGVYGHSTAGTGVWAQSDGVALRAESDKGVAGVFTITASTNGGSAIHAETAGVGEAVYAKARTRAVFATSDTDTGLWAQSNGGADGIHGITNSNINYAGVSGVNGGEGAGVYGVSAGGNGIHGSSLGGGAGMYGDSLGSSVGVFGNNAGSGTGVFGNSASGNGVVGQTGTPSNGNAGPFAVLAIGSFGATNGKYFVEPHPTDPSKEIRYVTLEGPEAGTYFRGRAQLVNGRATISIPDHFQMVTAAEGLTVQLTPIGEPAVLYCITTSLSRIDVGGTADVAFNYQVNGVRKALADFTPIHDNTVFIPRSAAQAKRLAASLPAESVRRLIANGILNADHSVNAATAHQLGWDRRAGWNARPSKPEPPNVSAVMNRSEKQP